MAAECNCVDNSTADGNDNSLKELQRTKEAEINAAIIHTLDSLGYTFL